MKPINCLFSLILVLAIAAGISADAQTPSLSTVPNSPQPSATPPSTVQTPAVPDILKNPALLQQILSKLESETARANSAVQEAIELKANRDEWKQTAGLERARADALEKAEAARSLEVGSLRASVGFLRTSVDEYKLETADLRRENEKLRGSRKWYLATGAAAGIAAGFYLKR